MPSFKNVEAQINILREMKDFPGSICLYSMYFKCTCKILDLVCNHLYPSSSKVLFFGEITLPDNQRCVFKALTRNLSIILKERA